LSLLFARQSLFALNLAHLLKRLATPDLPYHVALKIWTKK
jgi:hypothetical protein